MIPMIPLMPTAGLVDLLGPTTLLALGVDLARAVRTDGRIAREVRRDARVHRDLESAVRDAA
ncbi:MAG: hypothetical protein E6J75_06290 [Deltaproteobacteria bacterium]|nr:MAG: hypothetical protein E6J75_06290 [Deltaproteobacteria bacterium]